MNDVIMRAEMTTRKLWHVEIGSQLKYYFSTVNLFTLCTIANGRDIHPVLPKIHDIRLSSPSF
ncbi:hypothetical protein BC938DRAFT_476557 [Jimgerdemannia flammicorona]|uniref:Uncharacterized protein n=1 Tax=Jimgerdemannia flammicorona TaxID=994334 RepID=A0A433QQE9_9FUNG|nr:hypothetical protein BC938DRAFT_476557 [Jimgerdemannia flammicorona]